jgi:hypothetical protein
MGPWNRMLVVAGLSVLGPSVVALSHAGAAVPSDPAAIEDALLVRLGEVLIPSASAEVNAAAIARRLRRELHRCGLVRVDGSRVCIEATGCVLSDGLRLGEPLSVTIHRSARGLTVVMTDGVTGAPVQASAAEQVSAGAVAARR